MSIIEQQIIQYQIQQIKEDMDRIQRVIADQKNEYRLQYWIEVLETLNQKILLYNDQIGRRGLP
jgi:hypothetical protein